MQASPHPGRRAEIAEALAGLACAPVVLADEERLRPFETDGFIVRRAPDPTGRLLAVLGIGLLVWWLVSCRTAQSLNR